MAIAGTESVEILAPLQRVRAVLLDVEAYPGWMPAYRKATVLERDQQGRPRRVEFEAERYVTIRFTLEYEHSADTISYRRIAGGGRQNEGTYRLEAHGASTRATLEYTLDPGAPVPDFIIRPGIKKSVAEDLAALKRRAER